MYYDYVSRYLYNYQATTLGHTTVKYISLVILLKNYNYYNIHVQYTFYNIKFIFIQEIKMLNYITFNLIFNNTNIV